MRHYDFLIVDIVGYSQLSGEDQVKAIQALIEAVRQSQAIRETTDGTERIFLPTGDGMVIGFVGRPTRPLELAVEVHKRYGDRRHGLKMGIHSGIAFQIDDINGSHNVAGSGINLAARVLSCCNGGHILVGDEPGHSLKNDYDTWRHRLLGPYEFVVKHSRELTAYNLTDGSTFGNPDETFHNLFFKGSYARLKTRLAERGVTSSPALRNLSSSKTESLVIDEVIVDLPLAGFTGVRPGNVVVDVAEREPWLPDYVVETRSLLPQLTVNRPKVYLTHATPPISDRDGTLRLELAKSNFQTSRAIERCLSQLQDSILNSDPPLHSFPRRLDCPIVVVTADKKMVLCRRAANDVVRYFPLTWEVTIGESMDAELDHQKGGLHPLRTVQRGLTEELGVPEDVAGAADVAFLAIATEWRILAANLIAVAKLPSVDSGQLFDWFPGALDREHTHIDAIDFRSPDEALEIFTAGRHRCKGEPGTAAQLNDVSRVAVLLALCHAFGYQKIVSLL